MAIALLVSCYISPNHFVSIRLFLALCCTVGITRIRKSSIGAHQIEVARERDLLRVNDQAYRLSDIDSIEESGESTKLVLTLNLLSGESVVLPRVGGNSELLHTLRLGAIGSDE